jgi:hypothetical protein
MIDEHALASDVGLPQWSATAAPPRRGREAVAIAVGRRSMLFPQQLQRHPRPAQLTVDCRPLRMRPVVLPQRSTTAAPTSRDREAVAIAVGIGGRCSSHTAAASPLAGAAHGGLPPSSAAADDPWPPPCRPPRPGRNLTFEQADGGKPQHVANLAHGLGSGITRFVQKERSHAHSRITQRRLSPPSKGSSRSPESVAGFRRLVAIAIIRRAQLQFVSAPRFIKGLDRNFSSK